MHRLPTSTLYPYTTLFRSSGFDAQLLSFAEDLREEGLKLGTSEMLDAFEALKHVPWTEPECDEQDRKSTRLNSSHTVISYAVFCLKKKTLCEKIAGPRARH